MGGSPKEIVTVVEPRRPCSPDFNNFVKDDSVTSSSPTLPTGVLRLEMEEEPKFYDVPLIMDEDDDDDLDDDEDIRHVASSQELVVEKYDASADPQKAPIIGASSPVPKTLQRFSDYEYGVSPDATSIISTTRTTTTKRNKTKSVVFADIVVRNYSVVIGDHPCCTMGCPLSLGWDYSSEECFSVDEFEAHRPPRRSRHCLRTTWDERRQMLSNFSDSEVRRAQRRSYRERSCRSRVCNGFFQDLPPSTTTDDDEADTARHSSVPVLGNNAEDCTVLA